MFTPVSDNGEPAYDELEKLTELLISQGMAGLYILGSTGQGILFSTEQRQKVAELVVQTVAKRVPVMVQVGALTTAESMKLAEHAGRIGVQGISTVGPIYYGPTPDMAIEHYTQIASVTDLPFFPYQLGANFIPGDAITFVQRLMEIPTTAGMKLTTNQLLDISVIHNYAGDRLKLFSGSDELFCHASLCGTVGAIGSFYNLWGVECSLVLKEFKAGNYELPKEFMLRFQHIIHTVMPNIWTFLRGAMKVKHGIDIGPTKHPLANTHKPWDENEVRRIMAPLEEIGSVLIQEKLHINKII